MFSLSVTTRVPIYFLFSSPLNRLIEVRTNNSVGTTCGCTVGQLKILTNKPVKCFTIGFVAGLLFRICTSPSSHVSSTISRYVYFFSDEVKLKKHSVHLVRSLRQNVRTRWRPTNQKVGPPRGL